MSDEWPPRVPSAFYDDLFETELDDAAQVAIDDAALELLRETPPNRYAPGTRKLRSILAARPDALAELDSIYRLGGYAALKKFASDIAREHVVDLPPEPPAPQPSPPPRGMRRGHGRVAQESAASRALRTGFVQGMGDGPTSDPPDSAPEGDDT